MYLRQVALAVRELDRAVEDICAVLGVPVCFTPEDEMALRGRALIDEFGLENAVFVVGDTFLEVVTPARQNTTIDRFLRARGDSGYMVLVQCLNLAAARQRAIGMGIREVWQAPLDDLDSVHLDPRDTGGSFLSLDRPHEPTEWPWAGTSWREVARTDVTSEIVGVEIATEKPDTLVSRWSTLLDRPVDEDSAEPAVLLDRGQIHFGQARAGQPDTLCRVDIRCPDPGEVVRRARKRDVAFDDSGRPILAGVPFALIEG
ncbi:glyoxalase-like protein [Tamaricihabitans halophyticus]|uniref:Glyoxalase-like protein n=1 Tax=Tamaricihabitans halophyticus TaxID=1262583 RepID=A0A4R2QE58_9PSEU|nr:VOC family protein [Tamaricihabitans halophyticus]TCP47267.1 glyoxalase-like protein [Tamaricihabitans halophyticus]